MTDRNFYWPCPYGCTMLKQYIQNVETLTEENKRLRKIIDKQSEKISRLRKKNRDLTFGDTLPW
jgi:predicted RNase H-like nuclease (RuvC/YqgF family)